MGSSYRPENPYTPKPPAGSGTVTSGPLIPVGTNADDLAALSVGTPRERIALALGLARAPLATQQAVAQRVRKLSAPGTFETAANIATGNLIAPFSDRAANSATEHDLDAYAQGGGNPAKHATLFGSAAALGAVAGNTALAGTGRAAAATGSRLVEAAPLAKTALGRIGQAALSGGVTNAAIGAGSEALFGDEHGQRNVGDVVRAGLEQGAVGAAAGGALGGVSEAAGALARRLRPENPYAVHPVVEAAHDVAKEEAPDAIQQNAPTPEFRAENPYAAVADSAVSRGARALAPSSAGGAFSDAHSAEPAAVPTLRVFHANPDGRLDGDRFDMTRAGSGALAGARKRGGIPALYFTDSREHAAYYGTPFPVDVTLRSPLHVDAAGALDDWREEAFPGQYASVQDMVDHYYDGDPYQAYSADEQFNQHLSAARKAGHDGVIVDFGDLHDRNGAPVGRVVIATDPAQARMATTTQPSRFTNRTGAVGNLGARGSTSPLRQYAGLAAVRFPDGAVFVGGDHAQALMGSGRPESSFWDAGREEFRRDVAHGSINRDGQFVPRSARSGALNPQLLARGGSALVGGAAGATYGASQGDTPEEKAQLALEYGALGAGAGAGLGTLATSPEARGAIRSGYRSLMVTPYAKIEGEYPELTDALHKAGAATQTAAHIAQRRTGWVTEGLDSDQQRAFTNVLLRDTNLAKADAATARGETDAAQRFQQMAADHDANVPTGTEQQQWFQDALAKHKQFVGDPLEQAAGRAGVSSILPVQSAYLRGVSRDRMENQELRRAMDARAITDPAKLQPRGPVARALIGERPEVTRLERTTGGTVQGPINPNLPTTPQGAPPRSPGATRTGSAKAAQGTAREYVSDYPTLVQRDAEDKIVRGATNDVYGALDRSGFQRLADNEDPPIGMQALTRTIPGPDGTPVQERWAVPKAVKDAVSHFEQKRTVTDASGLWRKVTGAATRMQIAGMPVEATSHMNTLASIVASVPGEKDKAGAVMAAIPAVGAKAAAIREMAGIDFRDPATRQLETRLADIGALRIEPHQGGLINTSHNALFGPEGVDVRGRLVLARKYLAKQPNATDGALREFITSKLGNYNRLNSGTLVNGLQDSGLSAFARFQAARIPSSVRSTFGASGLPTTGVRDRLSTIGQTLYRGPVGYAAAGEAANYAMTGHRMEDNERGHQTDVQLPFTVGANNDPTYLPLAFTNPVLATGARVTGARDLAPLPGSPNIGGKIADAGRDVVNTGLGVLSPFARALSVAATGRTPYALSDGSMLRVTNNRFDKGRQAADNLKAAVSLANPAMSAFAEQGGDLGGHRLSDALSEDGKRFGGPKAVGAKAAEFLFPRVLTLGVGGRDNALSADSRDQREYMAAMQDYTAALRRAPGPIAQEAIIRQAVKDAETDGRFAPDMVERDLRKVLEQDGGRAQDRRERSLTKWMDTHAQ